MKTLTRHLLYLASFLALLLFVAGLTLFRETPVLEVAGGVLAIIATVAGVGWLSYRLNRSPTRPRCRLVFWRKKVDTDVGAG